jgi:hypothetical protein
MGPPSYMRSVVDRNVVMLRMTVTLVLISILSFKSGVSNTVGYKRVKSFPLLPRFVLAVINNAAEIWERCRSVY